MIAELTKYHGKWAIYLIKSRVYIFPPKDNLSPYQRKKELKNRVKLLNEMR